MLYLKRLRVCWRAWICLITHAWRQVIVMAGALRQEQFMVSRMKTPINRIYRKLFAGQLSPVSIPEE